VGGEVRARVQGPLIGVPAPMTPPVVAPARAACAPRTGRRVAEACCDEPFDLTAALADSGIHHLSMILRRQVFVEQSHGGQVDRALSEPLQNIRKPAHGSRGNDAVVRLAFRKGEPLPAILKQGPEAGGQVQAARGELRQMRDHRHSCVMLAPCES
jgi:hypothetical protein